MEIAGRLRERRRELGKTQEQIAREASMNVTQYNAYERGRSVPSPVTLPRLAKALQTSPEILLRRGAAQPDRGETTGEVLRRLRNQFRAQVAAELDLIPDDIAVRVEIF